MRDGEREYERETEMVLEKERERNYSTYRERKEKLFHIERANEREKR